MQANKIKDAHASRILKQRNICGAGVGKKWVDGKPTNQDAVLIFVEKKLTKNGVLRKYSAEDLIPKKIDGVPTDVIEAGKIIKHAFTGKVRPLRPGYSCGHGKITAGTIGGFFRDRDGDPIMLSNNHVVANENDANIGDLIFQPGPADSRANRRFRGWEDPARFPYIGALKKFVRLNSNSNTQDSAIVRINDTLIRDNLINDVYPVINRKMSGFKRPEVNMQVQKCGRTTGYTNGRVLALNASFSVGYDFGVARFDKCVVLSNMSKGGDSGSIIFDVHMNAVALLFAGSSSITIANDMELVKNHYGLNLWKETDNTNTIKLGGHHWELFTRDGQVETKNNIATITDNANHHCFLETSFNRSFNSISCTINTGSDRGATWGPGLTIQWPNGMLKVNLRYGGSFGGGFNSIENLAVGKTKPNTDYNVRFRRTRRTYVGEVQDNGKWYTVIEVPRSIFPTNPVAVRIGKTGRLGHIRDYRVASDVGTCSIRNFKVS